MLAPIAVGSLLFLTHGLPGRLSPDARALASLEETDVNPARETCFTYAAKAKPDACRFGVAPGSLGDEVIVWGDSHADAVTPGVVEWAKARGWSVREIARGGCPPLIGLRVRTIQRFKLECAPIADQALAAVAADRTLKLVVLAARWPLYRDAPPFYDVNSPRVIVEAIDQPGHKASISAAMRATLAAIRARNPEARVLVLGPVPELTLAPPECLAQQRQLGGRPEACDHVAANLPLARALPAEDAIRAALQDRPGVTAVFPSEDLCPGRDCLTMMAGRPLYFDDDHLGAWGARQLVPIWLDRGWARLEAP